MLYLYQTPFAKHALVQIWDLIGISLGCAVESCDLYLTNICPLLQAAVMSPPVDTSMSLHPTAMLTQQMGQLSLGSTGAVSKMGFIGENV